MDIVDYIKETEFYNLLTQDDKNLVKENLFIKEYDKNEMVHCCTGSCLGMIFVLEGSIRTSIISEEGRELTLFKTGAGECCVLSAACVLHEIRLESAMTAECNTKVLILSAKILSRIVNENTTVKCFCYEMATKRFSQAIFVLQEIILLSFDKRLAKYLVNNVDGTGEKLLRLTQERVASDVNSAREVVSRMLKQFEIEGYVKLGRGTIEILDLEGLRELI